MGRMFRTDCEYMGRDRFMNRVCKKKLDCTLSCKYFKDKMASEKTRKAK